MYAARLLYSEIGREVARRKFDSVSQRAVVSWQRKARVLADAAMAATRVSEAPSVDSLQEADFLLGSIPASPEPDQLSPAPERNRDRRPRVDDRVAWLVDLFERLERRDRALEDAVNLS
jgi:phytoene synthase